MTSESLAAARSARRCQRRFGSAPGSTRDRILATLAELLSERQNSLLEANQRDLETAAANGLTGPLLGRLGLSVAKLETLHQGVEQLAGEADPIGRALRRTELDEDLVLTQVKSPIGVLLVIFESRPDAVIQIGSLALRSGNAVLLKGGSEALHSNRALIRCLRDAVSPPRPGPGRRPGVEGREAASALLEHDELIDLVIPRGSDELVRSIQGSTRIPCWATPTASATSTSTPRRSRHGNPAGAGRQVRLPAACNAVETLLVHREFLPRLDELAAALADAGVELRADSEAMPHCPGARRRRRGLGHRVRRPDPRRPHRGSLDEAIEHIHRTAAPTPTPSSPVTPGRPTRFLDEVDSASVFVNASTRFADGFRYGLGAEVGISTARIHARGPVGVEGLLTTRWLLEGNGQGAADYGPGRREFLHRSLPLE